MFLGGGFKYVSCSSLFGEMTQFDQHFSNGLKPPTRFNILYLISVSYCFRPSITQNSPEKKPWTFWAAIEVIGAHAHQDESQASEIAKKDHFGVSRIWFLVILPWFGGRPNIEQRK